MIFRKITSNNILNILIYLITVGVCCLFIDGDRRTDYLVYMSLLTISLVFFSISDLAKDNIVSNVTLVIAIIIFGWIMAFRGQTGIDDTTYLKLFYNVEGKNLAEYLATSSMEKGYLLLNFLLYYLTAGNYNITQVIITYFSFVIWGIALKKNGMGSSIPTLALLIWTHYYLLCMGAGLIRMFLAVAIVFYGLSYIWNDNWRKYIVCIFFAYIFHRSAIIMLFLLVAFIKKDFFYKHWKVIVLGLLIALPIVFIFIAKVLVPILGIRYAQYAIIRSLRISIGNFDVLPIIVIAMYNYPQIREDEKKKYIVGLVLACFSIIVSVYSSMVSLGRIIYYANLGILIIVSCIGKMRLKNKIDILMSQILIIYALLYMMNTGFQNDAIADYLIPYRTFLH